MSPAKIPLSLQVLVGAASGAVLGLVFGQQPYGFGLSNEVLGQLGMAIIRLLRALAAPLIFFAIVDAFGRTRFRWRQGVRLLGICLLNVTVACSIGLSLLNFFQPGLAWRGQLPQMLSQVPTAALKAPEAHVSLDLIQNLISYVPEAVLEPFLSNRVISIVLSALLLGAALRRLQDKSPADPGLLLLGQLINACLRLLMQLLEWVVALAPLAVLGATAGAVGRSGLGVLGQLLPFLLIILLGLAIQALIYYPLVAWAVGKLSPRRFLLGGADATLTGLSCNSSLATVPVTLRCLTENLGVSQSSARLAACVGTNLNNDGITLYEVMTAVFLAQALGYDLGLGQQLTIVAASLMAGIGVAGVPEAGLIVLPLVLGAAGLPAPVVEGTIALILPVDWIIARARTGVNVMADMVVAVMLDAGGVNSSDPEEPSEDLGPPAL